MTDYDYLKRRAYTYLLREMVRTLPLKPAALLGRRHYYIRPYYQIPLRGAPLQVLERKYGNAFVGPGESRVKSYYYIGLNTYCSKTDQQWALTHELAHIELGHVFDVIGYDGESEVNKALEKEAYDFSLFLACPDVILEHMGAYTAGAIYSACEVPYNIAQEKAKYFRSLKYKFGAMKREDPIEKMLVQNFAPYIANYHTKTFNWEFSDEFCFTVEKPQKLRTPRAFQIDSAQSGEDRCHLSR